MSDIIRIQDLTADEIRHAMAEVSPDKRQAVERFVTAIGGLENAKLAIQMLTRLERKAA
jgi:hypothetical protein